MILIGVRQGVSAAVMGSKLYTKLGYRMICCIAEDGDEEDSKGASTELLQYYPECEIAGPE